MIGIINGIMKFIFDLGLGFLLATGAWFALFSANMLYVSWKYHHPLVYAVPMILFFIGRLARHLVRRV